MFQTKFVEKIKTFYIQYMFSPKNHAVYEIMWKYMVQPNGSHITMYYGACALHTGFVRQ
jgi:hypothetical protein